MKLKSLQKLANMFYKQRKKEEKEKRKKRKEKEIILNYQCYQKEKASVSNN